MQMARVSFLLDTLWAFISSNQFSVPLLICFIINSFYYISVIFAGYWWLCYVEVSLESNFIRIKWLNYLALVPVVFTIIGVIASYWTGFFFYIDEFGGYHRGKYVLLHTFCCHLYSSFVSVHSFIKSFKTKNYLQAKEYRVLAIFLFFPLFFGIIQIIVPELPTVCVGLTLAYLYVYIDLQDLKVSIDSLTGINNRNQLIKYLINKTKNVVITNSGDLYLLILDVNKFKKINDTYGHVEGDRALIRVANAVKKANSNTNNFVGRYGGDEFIIVCSNSAEKEIKLMIEKINSVLLQSCKDEDLKYDLSVSVGYACYSKDMKNIQDFISAADKMLYENKKNS